MAARRSNAALRERVAHLNEVLGCVAYSRLYSYPADSPDVHTVVLPRGDAARLTTPSGYPSLWLSVVQRCRIDERVPPPIAFTIATVAYEYAILDEDGAEIIAYHWHPSGSSRFTRPHLHVSSRVRPLAVGAAQLEPRPTRPVDLAQMHITTGVISLADVVHLLIQEFSVTPLSTSWASILEDSFL